MMAGTQATRSGEVGSILLFLAITASIVGFLGYYTEYGFVSFPSAIVLGTQLILLLSGLIAAGARIPVAAARLWPLAAFSIWSLGTAVIGHDPLALRRCAIILIPGYLMALLACLDPKPHVTFARLARLLATISIASGLYALAIALFGYRLAPLQVGFQQLWNHPNAPGMLFSGRTLNAFGIDMLRPSGLTSNTNSLAILSALALAFSIFTGYGLQKFSRIRIAVLMLVAIVLLATASRGAILFLAIAGGLLWIRRTCPGKTAAILALCIMATPLALAALAGPGLGHAGSTGPLSIAPESPNGLFEAFHFRERLPVWAVAYAAVADHWSTGVGFGLVQERIFASLGMDTSAHSVPLSILLETGVPGLLLMLYAWFKSTTGILLRRSSPFPATGMAVAIIALYAHQSFDSSVFRYHFLHFIFCYLLGTVSNPELLPDERGT